VKKAELAQRRPPATVLDLDDARSEAMATVRKKIGNRVRQATVGGAAASPALMRFLRELFGRDIVSEGYATTEAGVIASNHGYLAPNVVFRIVDVPDLGYRYPCGELWVQVSFFFFLSLRFLQNFSQIPTVSFLSLNVFPFIETKDSNDHWWLLCQCRSHRRTFRWRRRWLVPHW
jgi:hypothetical protein